MQQIIFGTIKSYDDMGLFLKDLQKTSPEPKRNTVEVPGMDGTLDVTYGIGKEIRYKNRKITLEFVVNNYEYQWEEIFSEILNTLHGKRFHVYIEPDLQYYWDSFCSVNKVKSNRNKGTIVIDLDAKPYKCKDIEMTVPGSISGREVELTLTRKPVVPEFVLVSSGTIEFNGETYTMDAGRHREPEIQMGAGTHQMTITSAGPVKIIYQDGSL